MPPAHTCHRSFPALHTSHQTSLCKHRTASYLGLQANDGKVLRFWAVWDDRASLYGDRRPYVVHFYLAGALGLGARFVFYVLDA